eukprot:12920391-Alexandrium_andersonii.AAC.1
MALLPWWTRRPAAGQPSRLTGAVRCTTLANDAAGGCGPKTAPALSARLRPGTPLALLPDDGHQ